MYDGRLHAVVVQKHELIEINVLKKEIYSNKFDNNFSIIGFTNHRDRKPKKLKLKELKTSRQLPKNLFTFVYQSVLYDYKYMH